MFHSVKLTKDQIKKYYNKNRESYKKFIPKNFYNMVNKLNGSSQATKPKNIGQMSEIVPEFMEKYPLANHVDFEAWFNKKYSGRFESCFQMFREYVCEHFSLCQDRSFTECMEDKVLNKYLANWFYNFVIVNNFYGFAYQKIAIEVVADELGESYTIATPDQESKNIDAIIGPYFYSVKSSTWKLHSKVSGIKISSIIKMIYYTKEKDNLIIEYEN